MKEQGAFSNALQSTASQSSITTDGTKKPIFPSSLFFLQLCYKIQDQVYPNTNLLFNLAIAFLTTYLKSYMNSSKHLSAIKMGCEVWLVKMIA